MAKRGKNYRKSAELVDSTKIYGIDEAVDLLKKTSTTKFNASCELHLKLGVDPRQADQLSRSTVSLPNGTGKDVRVVAFVNENKVNEALEAGAVKAGLEELIEEISNGWLEFDVTVASPEVMKNLGKIAKTLGTKGLMPNPKAGTITPDIGKVVKELKGGRVEYRTDKQGQMHNVFGKTSFTEDQLKENLEVLLKAINDNRPSGAKGNYITSASVASSMGPGIKLDTASILKK